MVDDLKQKLLTLNGFTADNISRNDTFIALQ